VHRAAGLIIQLLSGTGDGAALRRWNWLRGAHHGKYVRRPEPGRRFDSIESVSAFPVG